MFWTVYKFLTISAFAAAAGVTGGFAGGEKGVKQFVESGDIKFDEKGTSCSMCSGSILKGLQSALDNT